MESRPWRKIRSRAARASLFPIIMYRLGQNTRAFCYRALIPYFRFIIILLLLRTMQKRRTTLMQKKGCTSQALSQKAITVDAKSIPRRKEITSRCGESKKLQPLLFLWFLCYVRWVFRVFRRSIVACTIIIITIGRLTNCLFTDYASFKATFLRCLHFYNARAVFLNYNAANLSSYFTDGFGNYNQLG